MNLNEAIDHEVKRLLMHETALPPAYQAEVARRAREAQEDEPMTSEPAPSRSPVMDEDDRIVYELPENQGCPETWDALIAEYNRATKALFTACNRAGVKLLRERDADGVAGILRTVERATSDINDYRDGSVPV